MLSNSNTITFVQGRFEEQSIATCISFYLAIVFPYLKQREKGLVFLSFIPNARNQSNYMGLIIVPDQWYKYIMF